MNTLEVIVLVICAALILDGFRVGLVKTVFSIIKMIVGIVLGVIICSSVNGMIGPEVKYVVPVLFFVIFGGVFGILCAVENLLNLVDKLPVTKQLNRVAGIIGGAVKCIILIWILFCVSVYFVETPWGTYLNNAFLQSKVLGVINEFNPLVQSFEMWKETILTAVKA